MFGPRLFLGQGLMAFISLVLAKLSHPSYNYECDSSQQSFTSVKKEEEKVLLVNVLCKRVVEV